MGQVIELRAALDGNVVAEIRTDQNPEQILEN